MITLIRCLADSPLDYEEKRHGIVMLCKKFLDQATFLNHVFQNFRKQLTLSNLYLVIGNEGNMGVVVASSDPNGLPFWIAKVTKVNKQDDRTISIGTS